MKRGGAETGRSATECKPGGKGVVVVVGEDPSENRRVRVR
jgi:hypothetical protein